MRKFQGIFFLYEHEHIGRFSNLHQCTFKQKNDAKSQQVIACCSETVSNFRLKTNICLNLLTFKNFRKNQSANECVRSVSLQQIGFFGTSKPIYCKITDSVLSSVGFIFETVLYQQCTKIYTKINQIQDNITKNERNNCKIQKSQW